MLTQHGARTPGYPQAEGSGPEAHVKSGGGYPLRRQLPESRLRRLPLVDDEAKVGEGKTTVIYRQSRSRSGTTEKLLSAAQELNAAPKPLCARSALAAGGLRVQLA